ncbi:NADPH:quinone reductase [Stakelama sp. CBK3Z-3]|uniref:NADPH:quinone reductase n=1 Tax=Stakelama flava TaxID=2860338 RepID=A0ABS6XJV0_9SPHN|nr:NADPH:quinone reductase [Stakelama flava]MBW4330088.1 NADPH:quinone reductase [Stakelama flava]
MRAAYYDRQGSADDVLIVGNVPDCEPGPGEVKVRIAISGLNPTDIKARSGFAGMAMPFPRVIPHQDGAGTIEKVGPGVSPDRIGERVWLYKAQYGRAFGTAAEYAVIPADLAVPLPDNASFPVGATLGIAGMTAHRCLFADGDIRGQRILVQGGAGAVGTAAILLAKWAGAWVAATVGRPEQAKVASAAGADLVINRHDEDVAATIRQATKGSGVDRIIEVDLVTNFAVDIACLAPNGAVAAYATEDADAKLVMPFRATMMGGYAFRFIFFTVIPDAAFRLAIKDLTACLGAGAYEPHIGLELPLEKIAQAHAAQESGQVVGKILLRTAD